MADTASTVALFLAALAPVYIIFLRTLRQLSRQKSEALNRLPGGASQS